jgi:hypothetical protein
MPMKNSSDTIGNRTRYLPACSAVPQPTAPPRAPSTSCTTACHLNQLRHRVPPSTNCASAYPLNQLRHRVHRFYLEFIYLMLALFCRRWPVFRRLVAGVSPRSPASDPSPVQFACMADKADNVAGFCTGTAMSVSV